MNQKQLAEKILELVGGSTNVNQVWNCFTRLRFNLQDESKAKLSEIEKLTGVLGVRLQNGQVQVIVGNDVAKVYEEIEKLYTTNSIENKSGSKMNIITMLLDVLSGVFTPILPAIVAGGMLKALISLLTVFRLLDPAGSFMFLLNVVSDAPFYFLPFLLAVSASRKFKTNEFLGIALAGILMYPSIIEGATSGIEPLKFLFLQIPYSNYSTSVLPIILSVYVLSLVYRSVDKVVPQMFKIILTPLVSLLITAPIMLIFLAPIGSYAGVYLASATQSLLTFAAPLAGFVAGGTMSLIVMTGMHYAFFPAAIQSFGTLGYEMFLFPSNIIANLAQAGAAMAVGFKAKDIKVKSLGYSTGVSALFGITEPAIFGINMKYRKPFFGAMIAGAISGAFAFTFGIRVFAFAAPGILSLPAYVDPSGAALNFIITIVSILASFTLSFVFTLFSKIEGISGDVKEVPTAGEYLITAPLKGKLIQLSEVNDKTFSEGIMGKGVGIIPASNNIVSPVDGEIVTVFRTKHAITIRSVDGVELLIHVGLDTVNLEGKHFKVHVVDGQKISRGDLLLEFDRKAMIKEKYDVTTELVVLNSSEFSEIELHENTDLIDENQEVIKILK